MGNKVTDITAPPFKSAFEAEKAFYLAFVRRDNSLMQKVWANTLTTYCLHPGNQPVLGTKAILHSWQEIFNGPQTTELKIEHQNLATDSNIAVHRVTEHLTLHENKENKQLATVYSINVFQCINDSWYLISHQSAPAPQVAKPAGETMH